MSLSARISYLIRMDGDYDAHRVYTPEQMAGFWFRWERYALYCEGLESRG